MKTLKKEHYGESALNEITLSGVCIMLQINICFSCIFFKVEFWCRQDSCLNEDLFEVSRLSICAYSYVAGNILTACRLLFSLSYLLIYFIIYIYNPRQHARNICCDGFIAKTNLKRICDVLTSTIIKGTSIIKLSCLLRWWYTGSESNNFLKCFHSYQLKVT